MTPHMRLLLVLALACVCTACGGADHGSDAWVRVVTPEGHAFPGDGMGVGRQTTTLVAVNATAGTARECSQWKTVRDRGLNIPTLYAGERLVLLAAGFRDLEIPVPPPLEPVTLAYGFPVRIVLETEGELPAAPYEIELALQWRGAGDLPEAPVRAGLRPAAREGWFQPEPSGADDPGLWLPAGENEIAFYVSTPARYRVTWTLHRVHRAPGVRTAQGVSDPSAGTNIEIHDTAEEQVIRVVLDRRALDEALAVLER